MCLLFFIPKNYLKYRRFIISIKIKKRYQKRVFKVNEDKINEQIRYPKVLVKLDDGETKIIPTQEAIQIAKDQGKDLILIYSKGETPVAKIEDYNKFKYQRKRKKEEQAKNQKMVLTKEIRLSPNIGEHDLQVRVKKAREFIEKGHRIKISLKYKGRQMNHKEIGYKTMESFLDSISDIAQVDKRPKLQKNFYNAFVSPNK